MSCYISLLRSPSSTRQLCQNIRSFSLIHQNSANVIPRRNGANFLSKRFKSDNPLSNKPIEEVKVTKVKLKVSDLRRLLSLAKKEKWKISGKTQELSLKSFIEFHKRFVILGAIGCLIISSSITMAVPFGLGKILDIIYSSESVADTGAAKEKLDQ